jgi:FTR1 family protein
VFEALAITLREGVEGALVLAVALAFLERRGLSRLKPALWAGTALALVASAVLAVLATRLTYNEELAEGIAMLVAFVMVLSLVIWMWKAGPHMKEEVESGLSRAAAGGGGSLAVFLFAFGMVLREGAETAIFLSAASFSSEGLALWIGALIGLGLAMGFGILFVRGTLRIPLKPFFSLTSAVLLLISIQLLVGGLHELSEAEVLPASRREMSIIGPLVKNELLLFTLTVAVAAFWLLRRPASAPPKPGAPTEGPEARLARAASERDSRRRRWTGIVGLVVVGLLATAFARGSRTPAKEPATPVTAQDGKIRLDAAAISDGHMHFFETTLPAGTARLFAIKVGDKVQVCFDACEICGDRGYFESKGALVCRNCTSPIALSTIGRGGGCNPIPVPHEDVQGPQGPALEIRTADLEQVLPKLGGR